jgi:hypothetical protein
VRLRVAAETGEDMTEDIPIACTLSAAEVSDRARTVLAALRAHARGITELPDGYAIELTPSDEAIAAATQVIQLERRCCRFLRFTLTVEPAEGGVTLALTGAPGVRDFLSAWLAPGARAAASAP